MVQARIRVGATQGLRHVRRVDLIEPTPELKVRRLAPTDAEAQLLTDFGARLFVDAFGTMNEPENLREFLATTYSSDLQLAELRDPNRIVWLAESNDVPLGYAMLRRESRSPSVDARHPAEVQRIYADRAWHGRGVGKALLDACIGQARVWKADVVWLGVWERNPRAIAFYQKWGFRRVGEQRFLVGADPQRDHVMALRLE